MLTLVMLYWIGYTLNAPAWFWWLFGILALIRFIEYSLNLIKIGNE